MIAVFKREFSSAFSRLYGYIAIGLALIASAIIFSTYNLLYAVETVNSTYSMMSIVMAFIIPIVALGVFPNRKKENTDSQYDVVPTSTLSVILGKYLAAYAIVLIPTAFTALYPLIAGMFGLQDHAQSYSSFLALILFEAAWLAVCFFIARISKSRLRAGIWCYAVGILWFFSGVLTFLIPMAPIASLIAFLVFIPGVGALLWWVSRRLVLSLAVTAVAELSTVACYFVFTEKFSSLFEAFICSISIFRHFETFSYGIFEIEGILFFLVVSVLFVFLTWSVHESSYEKKVSPMPFSIKKTTSLFLAVLLVALSLGVTVAAAIVPDTALSYDISGSKRSTVSKEAKDFLRTVDKDVTIYLLEPTGLENYELYLEKIAACSPHIKLEKIYYSSNPEFYTEIGRAYDSVTANSLVVRCGENTQYLSYYNLCKYANPTFKIPECTYEQYSSYTYQVALNYSNDQATLMAFELGTETYFNGDTVICEVIGYVTADVIPTWYYLDGHGELSLNSAANPFSGATALSLNGKIPDDAAAILINMPTSDISVAERDMLLDYLERGGQLTFITTPENLDMPNICAVLAAYGLSAEKKTVEVSVTETVENEEGEKIEVTNKTDEFIPVIQSNNDVFYLLSSLGDFESTIKGANPIVFDQSTATASEFITDIPLLTTPAGEGEASYTVARAVEAPSGAKLVWFTAGKSVNDVSSDIYVFAALALEWVTLKFENQAPTVPARLYVPSSAMISSMTAIIIPVAIVVVALGIMTAGGILYYRRRHGK
ncbi:MAG: hypothetical protein E7577_01595 [Ruminococcaceae bacterium]|nr:hypothetical protein [Oscillospiraceae bacterium]